ncbi:hypothetical protein CI102_5927, partial [Trichoderma harzianum]
VPPDLSSFGLLQPRPRLYPPPGAWDWIGSHASLLRACTRTCHVRGSAHFHTPQSLACTVKASAPPGTLQSRSPNLLVHEAASARRNLDRPLSPRPGHLTPFIIGSLPTSLLRRHHQPFSPSSPFHQLPATCCSWFCCCTLTLTLPTTFAASAAAIFCRTLR